MKPTAPNLIRLTGLCAMAAGIIFAGIQPIHPPDALPSVTTEAWAIITPLKVVMCLLFLLGWTGLYASQVKAAGWLGLAGFLLLSLCWALQTAFIFAEAFVVPLLATTAPAFVDGYLGIAAGRASDVNLGVLQALFAFAGVLYVLGGLLFGIATVRAGRLPRWAAQPPCHSVRAHARRRVVPAPGPEVRGDSGGGGCDRARLCTLVTTRRASPGTRSYGRSLPLAANRS